MHSAAMKWQSTNILQTAQIASKTRSAVIGIGNALAVVAACITFGVHRD
jgi:hypothetical protein